MEHRVVKLETDMVDVKTRLAVAESNIKDVKEDISSIKDDTRWLRRTVTSVIIGIVIAAIIAVIKLGGI
ncbi:hemolysin XhlA family protein [Psychrobacillus sp. NPDC096426]|uniref:hemolysin XhlA family protein n=1 Tax=Psychrobacillus sp. NPDC096426 TaxID=3364491 RepID=UPI00382C72D3